MAIGFDPDAYVAGLSDAERRNMMLYGANLATYEERKAVGDALRRAAVNDPSSMGGAGMSGGLVRDEPSQSWDGTYADGSIAFGRPGSTARGVNEIPAPDGASPPLSGGPGVQDPTAPGVIDWGGANVPPPQTDTPLGPIPTPEPETAMPPMQGGPGGTDAGYDWDTGSRMEWTPAPNPRDMNWDWGRFGVQTDTGGFGQYFDNYDASSRYSPGEGAWWGSDRFPGDNRDFYQNQIANLLRQDQNFQARTRAAQQEYADSQGQEPMPLDWSWLEGGLPEVRTGSSMTTDPSYALRDDFSGLTNRGIIDALGDNLSEGARNTFDQLALDAPEFNDRTFWSGGDPNNVVETLQGADNPALRSAYGEIIRNVYDYTPGQSSAIPAGYAAPIAGMEFPQGQYGYQQGGAAYRYDPTGGPDGTGGWVQGQQLIKTQRN